MYTNFSNRTHFYGFWYFENSFISWFFLHFWGLYKTIWHDLSSHKSPPLSNFSFLRGRDSRQPQIRKSIPAVFTRTSLFQTSGSAFLFQESFSKIDSRDPAGATPSWFSKIGTKFRLFRELIISADKTAKKLKFKRIFILIFFLSRIHSLFSGFIFFTKLKNLDN